MKIQIPCLIALFLCFHLHLQAQDAANRDSLYHVLLLDWSDMADSSQKAEVYALFKALPAKIEGFERIRFAPVLRSNQNFDEVLIMVFRHEAALDTYQSHPDHLRIKEIALPLLSQMSKYDYWE